MQKNTSVSLGSHYEQFISQKIAEGRYGSASETIRAGLRLLEEHENRMASLRLALIEGENSGKSDYTLNGLIAELDSDINH